MMELTFTGSRVSRNIEISGSYPYGMIIPVRASSVFIVFSRYVMNDRFFFASSYGRVKQDHDSHASTFCRRRDSHGA